MSKQILKEKNKNGGPYTRKQQEDRRIQVCHLYFEENVPAVKIAELLNVHRNTINGDIRFWHLQYANELKPQELTSKMKKQELIIYRTKRTGINNWDSIVVFSIGCYHNSKEIMRAQITQDLIVRDKEISEKYKKSWPFRNFNPENS